MPAPAPIAKKKPIVKWDPNKPGKVASRKDWEKKVAFEPKPLIESKHGFNTANLADLGKDDWRGLHMNSIGSGHIIKAKPPDSFWKLQK